MNEVIGKPYIYCFYCVRQIASLECRADMKLCEARYRVFLDRSHLEVVAIAYNIIVAVGMLLLKKMSVKHTYIVSKKTMTLRRIQLLCYMMLNTLIDYHSYL